MAAKTRFARIQSKGKKNKPLISTPPCPHSEETMLRVGGKSRSLKVTHCMMPFVQYSLKDRIIEMETRLVVYEGDRSGRYGKCNKYSCDSSVLAEVASESRNDTIA